MGIFVCRRFLLTAAAGCAGICLMTGVTGCANWKMEREFRTALQFKAAGKNEQMLQKLQLAANSITGGRSENWQIIMRVKRIMLKLSMSQYIGTANI